jgi:hypothetical protein
VQSEEEAYREFIMIRPGNFSLNVCTPKGLLRSIILLIDTVRVPAPLVT